VYLETLESWTERNRSELEAAGVTVTLSDATTWKKPSQGVSLSTPDREGEVWSGHLGNARSSSETSPQAIPNRLIMT
jgi:hypothetical protein